MSTMPTNATSRVGARWMRRQRSWSGLLLAAALALALAPAPAPALAQPRNPAMPMPGDYRVEAGRVDPGTYLGWRLFHTTCYGCHGVGAVGTDLAPNLVDRMKDLSPRAFATKVLTSYRLVPLAEEANAADRGAALDLLIEQALRKERGAADLIAMPAWNADPRVLPHVLDLYAYLSARADGKLGPGRPLPMLPKRR